MNNTDVLKKLANLSPPSQKSNTSLKRKRIFELRSQSDMQEWFERWAATHCSEDFENSTTLYNGKIMYKLKDGCVFDRNHKDACILIRSDGKICYHCFHDSCSNYHWKDFRELYDPEKNRINTAWQGRKVVENGH